MERAILFVFLLMIGAACRNSEIPDTPQLKMIPDHTPYIAGLIEASPDTTFHYPEIVVGYFTDTNTLDDPSILVNQKNHRPIHYYTGLYSIMLVRQLTVTSVVFGLSWQPESHAVVKVRGPLGTPQEKEITFTSEGNGVYGDKAYALPRIAEGHYRLQVKLPDGRNYVSTTYIPKFVPIMGIKDSIYAKIVLDHYNDGEPSERGFGKGGYKNQGYPYTYRPSHDGFITVIQSNTNRDRQIELLDPGEKFLYTEYGNYLRDGSAYDIFFTTDSTKIKTHLFWSQDLTTFKHTIKPRDKIYDSKHFWIRHSFFSKGVGGMFFVPFTWYGLTLKYSHWEDRPDNAAAQNDTTFLHRVSTILKVGKNGKVLPKDSSDAIGFFAGEFSRYLQTTVYANRQFDLDSVLTAWHEQNK
jgi:hypothetical protein